MNRFYSPNEISKMEPVTRWITIFGITFIMSIGFTFEVFLALRGTPIYISVLPFYGMTFIAWGRINER